MTKRTKAPSLPASLRNAATTAGLILANELGSDDEGGFLLSAVGSRGSASVVIGRGHVEVLSDGVSDVRLTPANRQREDALAIAAFDRIRGTVAQMFESGNAPELPADLVAQVLAQLTSLTVTRDAA